MKRGTNNVLLFFCDVVFGKEVLWSGHGLELQVVSTGILEEHGVLLAWLAREPKVRLDDKLDALALEPVCQRVELGDAEARAKVRHRNFVAINRVVVVLPTIVSAHPVAHNLVAKPIEAKMLRSILSYYYY